MNLIPYYLISKRCGYVSGNHATLFVERQWLYYIGLLMRTFTGQGCNYVYENISIVCTHTLDWRNQVDVPRWKWLSPTMKNRGLGPLGTSILYPIFVIYAFGSMLSFILCERQKFSESHKLKRFGARNQFRAARFVTVKIIARSINAMEWVVEN